MIRFQRPIFALIVVALTVILDGLIAESASAQVIPGTPAFGSFGGGPDVVNLGNLNAHLDIPVLHKPGRGTDFAYDLTYDSSVWSPIASSWQPAFNWGWIGQSAIQTGYLSYSRRSYNCDNQGPPFYQYTIFSQFVYHDPWGGSHPFYGTMEYDPTLCDNGTTSTLNASANDGSGFALSAAINGAPNVTTHTITSPAKQVTTPPLNMTSGYSGVLSTYTDRNGNEISVNSTSSSATFTDTLNKSAVVVSGVAPTNTTFTYTTSTGGSAYYTMKYTTYTVRTNFGCSGITEFNSNGTAQYSLVSEIDLPDGSAYAFTYETTPGDTHTPHHVTGRLATVTLPTGGQIVYAYSGGSSGHIM